MLDGPMGFYDDIVTGLAGCVGKGKRFASNYAMAKFCDVHPTQMARYIKGERSANLKVLCDVLDRLGARVDWGDGSPGVSERTIKLLEKEYQDKIVYLERMLDAKDEQLREMLSYKIKWEGYIESLRAGGVGRFNLPGNGRALDAESDRRGPKNHECITNVDSGR